MSTYNLKDFKNKKIALVLSGGVVKAAAWHIGVTLALEELGFSLKSNRNSSPDSAYCHCHKLVGCNMVFGIHFVNFMIYIKL